MFKLDELKSYLKDLNYPGFSLMGNDEIADIFSKKNRSYFLSWFVQKWDQDIVLPEDETEKAASLANILYNGGFCTSQESIKFVNNSLELQPDDQLIIINRMLYNLWILNSTSENDACDIDYSEQMEILSKLDVNIFPTMGPIQIRKPEERLQKMEKVEQDIKELKKEIECMHNKYDSTADITLDKEIDWQAFDLVKDQISILIHNSVSVLKNQKEVNTGKFNDSFEAGASNCSQNIAEVSKLYDSKKVIKEFAPAEWEKTDKSNCALTDTIKILSLLSQEVLNTD